MNERRAGLGTCSKTFTMVRAFWAVRDGPPYLWGSREASHFSIKNDNRSSAVVGVTSTIS
jgi:hypothetical protein